MNKGTAFIIFALALILLIFSLPDVNSRTIIVDDDWSKADFHTIQDAYENSTNGDSIRIFEGRYFGSLYLNKNVSIMGNGTENTIFTLNDFSEYWSEPAPFILIRINNVSICNISIRYDLDHYSDNWYWMNFMVNASNITFSNVEIKTRSRSIWDKYQGYFDGDKKDLVGSLTPQLLSRNHGHVLDPLIKNISFFRCRFININLMFKYYSFNEKHIIADNVSFLECHFKYDIWRNVFLNNSHDQKDCVMVPMAIEYEGISLNVVNCTFDGYDTALGLTSDWSTIVSSRFMRGYHGIRIEGMKRIHGSNNTIRGCEFVSMSSFSIILAKGWGQPHELRDNAIYGNSFISGGMSNYFHKKLLIWPKRNKEHEFNSFVFSNGSMNSWDDGNHGNYWIGHDHIDSNENGIMDMSYFPDSKVDGNAVNSDERDRYPLLRPTSSDLRDDLEISLIHGEQDHLNGREISIWCSINSTSSEAIYDLPISLVIEDISVEFDLISDLGSNGNLITRMEPYENSTFELRFLPKGPGISEIELWINWNRHLKDRPHTLPTKPYIYDGEVYFYSRNTIWKPTDYTALTENGDPVLESDYRNNVIRLTINVHQSKATGSGISTPPISMLFVSLLAACIAGSARRRDD